ncbi:methylated-DNA--[protein]-cysteine S-methyltransferase [Methanospirillum lacunae]|uniref:Cysteine methyltransferase n=1 Tax=Methanospirillum lacunae TaxID=668570 RepID=A0A2V2N5N2_9EURY|nr:methylated-DNA--[protein]-cysteine S-methyltransferase [Methanospirillum lacunae]PWR73910.1 cysteine methyltransferase [Methanospirillum lacunae]
MEVSEGSCRLGLWYVNVTWDGNIVHRIRFQRTGIPGPVPEVITRYLTGKVTCLDPLVSHLPDQPGTYGRIYKAVQAIPYGSVQTYGEIALKADTSPRAVGLAMSRNTTPLLVPCHRVVASKGLGGFTPDLWIKEELLRIEASVSKKMVQQNLSFREQE